jgi:hypothetical protein
MYVRRKEYLQFFVLNSNMMSFIDYINNAMKELQVFFSSHIHIVRKIIYVIPLGIENYLRKMFSKKCVSGTKSKIE